MALRPHVAVGLLLSGISGKCRFSRKHSLCTMGKQIRLRKLGNAYGQNGVQTTTSCCCKLAEKKCAKEQLHATTSTAPDTYKTWPTRHHARGTILLSGRDSRKRNFRKRCTVESQGPSAVMTAFFRCYDRWSFGRIHVTGSSSLFRGMAKVFARSRAASYSGK